jgi:hypothetical protein
MYPLKYHKETGTSKNNAANYIVELVSQRKARDLGILLENAYWKDAVWQKFYREQKQAAHTLLGLFEESVVVSTIIEMRSVYSLRPKFVKDKMVEVSSLKRAKAKQNKLRIEQEKQTPELIKENVQTGTGRRPFNGKKSSKGEEAP